jgi:Trk K+ transport system NAD-binding subunit
MELAIIGASALGRQIAHIAKNNGINVTAFFDDTLPINSIVDDIPVLGNINNVDSNKSTFSHLIIGIGYKHFDARESIVHLIKQKTAE